MQNVAPGFLASHERKTVALLCVLGALHVFVFSAAFPFFNNVDEEYHADLVLKYSRGDVPRAFAKMDAETARDRTVYGSPEYLLPPSDFPSGNYPPPPLKWPFFDPGLQQAIHYKESQWENQTNFECSQAPLYYALGGMWWDAGKILGLREDRLLYWLRFMNVLLVALLVWTAFLAAKEIFPDKPFLKLGVPALLAFMPQTAFYSVNSDILSPLCFGIALIFLARWLRDENPHVLAGTLAGLALAATLLAKISNLPLFALALAVVLAKIWRLAKTGKLSASLPSIVSLLASALLPVGAWMAWCKANFGDWTGSAPKIQSLGWTLKPFADWWHHPLFTPSGLWLYTFRTVCSFWRGEFVWHDTRLYFLPADLLYVFSSLILIGAVVPAILRSSAPGGPIQRQNLGFLLACVLSMYAFFAFLSIIYDFHNCFYPSRAQPYFTSGRLLLGALVPFLLLFVFQLDRFLHRFSVAAKFSVLAAFILLILASEIVIAWPVFSSLYNWYHL